MIDDPAEILFQSFQQEAIVSSSGMGSDVHSLMLSIQHFLCWPWCCPPSSGALKVERLLWHMTCLNHASLWLPCRRVLVFLSVEILVTFTLLCDHPLIICITMTNFLIEGPYTVFCVTRPVLSQEKCCAVLNVIKHAPLPWSPDIEQLVEEGLKIQHPLWVCLVVVVCTGVVSVSVCQLCSVVCMCVVLCYVAWCVYMHVYCVHKYFVDGIHLLYVSSSRTILAHQTTTTTTIVMYSTSLRKHATGIWWLIVNI